MMLKIFCLLLTLAVTSCAYKTSPFPCHLQPNVKVVDANALNSWGFTEDSDPWDIWVIFENGVFTNARPLPLVPPELVKRILKECR